MLGGMVSNIKPDRTDLDLLYACLLDWGVEISLSHTQAVIDGCTVHNVDNGGALRLLCRARAALGHRLHGKQQPLRAVFRDSSFTRTTARSTSRRSSKTAPPRIRR